MNKTTKIVLIGLGVVAVGATAYFLLKPKSTEADMATEDAGNVPAPTATPQKGAKAKKIAKIAIPVIGIGALAGRAIKKRRANKPLEVV